MIFSNPFSVINPGCHAGLWCLFGLHGRARHHQRLQKREVFHSSSFRMVKEISPGFAWRMVMADVFICFYCHLLRAHCKEQEASSDGRLLLFYFRVACESHCTKHPGFFWRHTHSSVSGISEKEFYPESHPGSLVTAMHRTRSMDSAQSQRCHWTAGVVWLQIPSRSDPILFEMDWLTLKLIENWFNAWVFYTFLLGAPPHSIYDPLQHFVECIVGSQSWHVYAVKRSELSSERFNAAFSVGHGFVQTSEVLAKIPVLHGYIPMESQEPGEHGIQIWEFLEINSHFCTFLHVHIIHIILRWENKIRCWLPIAANTKISPGEPCRKRIAGGDRWWLTFCGSSRWRRFCRGVVFYVSKVAQCWWSTDDSIWFSYQLGSKNSTPFAKFHRWTMQKKSTQNRKNLGFLVGFGADSPSCTAEGVFVDFVRGAAWLWPRCHGRHDFDPHALQLLGQTYKSCGDL